MRPIRFPSSIASACVAAHQDQTPFSSPNCHVAWHGDERCRTLGRPNARALIRCHRALFHSVHVITAGSPRLSIDNRAPDCAHIDRRPRIPAAGHHSAFLKDAPCARAVYRAIRGDSVKNVGITVSAVSPRRLVRPAIQVVPGPAGDRDPFRGERSAEQGAPVCGDWTTSDATPMIWKRSPDRGGSRC